MGTFNFSVIAGNTFTSVLTWKNSSGTPINLTGYNAAMKVVDGNGETVLGINTETEGGITLGGVLGTITLLAQTADIVAGCYNYTLVLTSGGGVILTLLSGSFNLV